MQEVSFAYVSFLKKNMETSYLYLYYFTLLSLLYEYSTIFGKSLSSERTKRSGMFIIVLFEIIF